MDEYSVSCPCGKVIEVNESAAGTEVACSCGKRVPVPSLRELRYQHGAEQAPNPVLQIEYLLAAKKLPAESCCVSCGTETSGVLVVHAHCESIWRKGGQSTDQMLALTAWLGPLWALLVWASRSQDAEREFGSDVRLGLPLRVCPQCREQVQKMWRWSRLARLRELLVKVPEYRQLLERYPKARLSV
jgi:hypothetical protein